jgi:PIN domain nuclease of toxin-antitoxin system
MVELDTHIFVWSELEQERIPAKIKVAMDAETQWGVSAISLWEIAMLVEKGRITLPQPLLPWFTKVLSKKKIRLLPITKEIAARSAGLPMHGDPADRIIAATAIEYDCPLATVDGLLLEMPMLKTIG